jgi:hypothetical protein
MALRQDPLPVTDFFKLLQNHRKIADFSICFLHGAVLFSTARAINNIKREL